MGRTLDCHTLDSTIASLAVLFATTPGAIQQLLFGIDLEHIYTTERPDCDSAEYLFRLANAEFNSYSPPAEVMWFHLSRVRPGTRFEEGIMPLDRALDRVWALVLWATDGTPHKERLAEMQLGGVPNYAYSLKTLNSIHHGPYAMLVRDVAFRAREIGNHDYLWLPELVEDICNGYAEKYGEHIYDLIEKQTVPCIVKFRSAKYTDQRCTEAALHYVWCCLHSERFSTNSNTCFDAEGETIPPSGIVGVEYVSASQALR